MTGFLEALFTDAASHRPTADHLADRGRPARRLPHDGLPAYESATGALHVMEALLVFGGTASHPPMLLPYSYRNTTTRCRDDGLCALHDDPDAVWSWRPRIYVLGFDDTTYLGSQQELEYRRGIWEFQQWRADEEDALYEFVGEQLDRVRARYGRIPGISLDPGETGFRLPKNGRKRMYREYQAWVEARTGRPAALPLDEARRRADGLLRECLSPQQRLDLASLNGFYVRGEINRLYLVELGNGFDIVDPVTHERTVSLCLHPESWLPHADVALATKLSIDSGRDGEEEMLEAANPRLLGRSSARPDAQTRAAYRLEERHRLYP